MLPPPHKNKPQSIQNNTHVPQKETISQKSQKGVRGRLKVFPERWAQSEDSKDSSVWRESNCKTTKSNQGEFNLKTSACTVT